MLDPPLERRGELAREDDDERELLLEIDRDRVGLTRDPELTEGREEDERELEMLGEDRDGVRVVVLRGVDVRGEGRYVLVDELPRGDRRRTGRREDAPGDVDGRTAWLDVSGRSTFVGRLTDPVLERPGSTVRGVTVPPLRPTTPERGAGIDSSGSTVRGPSTRVGRWMLGPVWIGERDRPVLALFVSIVAALPTAVLAASGARSMRSATRSV